jgi:hypothetical protein
MFEVNPNAMTVFMDTEGRNELISLIKTFAVPEKRQVLKEFQCVAGRVNWALNVFPLLHPGLSALYAKTAGKERDLALIRVNSAMVRKLDWVACRVEYLTGIHFLKSIKWDPKHTESDAVSVFTDAPSIGMAYFIPSLKLAFQCLIPPDAPSKHIFFFEALAICSIFHFATTSSPTPHRLMIYSDNTNMVDIFNSLHASAPYDHLLISAINIVLDHEIDYWVLLVHGIDNPVADAVSHFKNNLEVSLYPSLVIWNFEPPRDMLGGGSK